MKKRGLILVLALVCALSTAGIATAYAAWGGSFKSEKNTVTVGQPLAISISGTEFNGDVIMPGGAAISTTFDVDLTDADGKTYKLVITGIEFAKGASGNEWSTVESEEVWKVQVDDGTPINLAEDVVIVDTAADGEITLSLSVTADLDVAYAGYELSFYVELVDTTVVE